VRRAELLLAAGALVGVALAVVGLVGDRSGGGGPVPDGAAAVVDGRIVSRADYQRAVAAVASDRGTPADDALRARVLARLIDEELLLQRGLELEIARTDRTARNATSAAVIDLLVARGRADAEPTDDALRAHFAAHPERFRTAERIRVDTLRFAGAGAAARAAAARDRMRAGADVSELAGLASPDPAAPPRAPLPPRKLRDYLGARGMAAVLPLAPGEVSEPLVDAGGARLLRVVSRVDGEAPRFEDVRDQVRADYLRRAGEQRLKQFLADRRHSARIAIAEDLR
jgi:parvulin-like peptidyl-prolyl isomerase